MPIKWLNRHQRGWGQVEWLHSTLYYAPTTGRVIRGLAYVRDTECGTIYPAEMGDLKGTHQLTAKVRKSLGM